MGGLNPFSGGGGSSGGTSTTVQKTEPFEGQKPFLIQGFQAAEQNILNRPAQFFPGQTVAGFSPETEAALQRTAQRAEQGSPLQQAAEAQLQQQITGQGAPVSPELQGITPALAANIQQTLAGGASLPSQLSGLTPAAQQQLGITLAGGQPLPGGLEPLQAQAQQQISQTLGGEFLPGGEGFERALDLSTQSALSRARREVLPQVESQFARAGRLDSGLAEEAQARVLGDIIAEQTAGAFANQFGRERSAQLGLAQQLQQQGLALDEARRQEQLGLARDISGQALGLEEARRQEQLQTTLGLSEQLQQQAIRERQNQLQASLSAPQLAQQEFGDLQALANVGLAREQQQQQMINESIARHQFEQQEAAQRAANFLGTVGLNVPGGTQTLAKA